MSTKRGHSGRRLAGKSSGYRSLLASSDLSPEEIDVAIEDLPAHVLMELAEHPDCPVAVLHRLANNHNGRLREAVAKNKNCPLVILRQLMQDDDLMVSAAALSNSKIPKQDLIEQASSWSWVRRREVAQHPKTDIAILGRLADDSDEDVRAAVASNRLCPEDAFLALADDGWDTVREAVANNPQCPVDLLVQLAQDDAKRVRQAAWANPHLPVHLRTTLSM